MVLEPFVSLSVSRSQWFAVVVKFGTTPLGHRIPVQVITPAVPVAGWHIFKANVCPGKPPVKFTVMAEEPILITALDEVAEVALVPISIVMFEEVARIDSTAYRRPRTTTLPVTDRALSGVEVPTPTQPLCLSTNRFEVEVPTSNQAFPGGRVLPETERTPAFVEVAVVEEA